VVKTMNSRGLLASIDRNGSDVVDRTYTDAGRLATQSFANGVVETWTWRNDGMVESINNPAGLFEYTYDANKNRTAEQITGPLSMASWTTGANGFDADDRLVYRNQGSGDLVEEWDLSLVGDWDEYTENSAPTARTHGPTHEILTVGNASLTHDSKGNLTTDEKGQLLHWDADNQLTSVDTNADQSLDVEYQYDALFRMVSRRDWSHIQLPPTNATYVHIHWLNDTAADYTRDAAPTAPLRDYIHGMQVDELIALLDRTSAASAPAGTDEVFYYHADTVTSIRAITDDGGNAVEYYEYASYGEPSLVDALLSPVTTSQAGNRHTFTAREWDSTTAAFDYRNRWLIPTLGRFVARDPLQYFDGSLLYSAYFVPRSVDPFGLVGGFNGCPGCNWFPPQPPPPGPCELFENWYRAQGDLSWTNDLPACPCNVTIGVYRECPVPLTGPGDFITEEPIEVPWVYNSPDPTNFPVVDNNPNRWGNFHPDAEVCLRSTPTDTGAGEQCCYDGDGKLITSGPSAGSSDYASPTWWSNILPHRGQGVQPRASAH
jgi:hypothetical protein